jgi:integrase
MATVRLTKRLVDSVEAPETGETWLWDTQVRGLGLKVTPGGRRVFAIWYRMPTGRTTTKLTLGVYGALTLDQARTEATKALGLVATGHNPARERKTRRQAPTVADALDDFLRDGEGKWKPRTAQGYRQQVAQHIQPVLGTRKVRDVSRDDVALLLRRLHRTPYLANRVLALVSSFMTWAIRAGLRPDGLNPAKHQPRNKEQGRTRFLTGDELRRLGDAITAAEAGTWTDAEGKQLPPAPWQSIAAIRLLALTGCRRGEILDLRWNEVDLERGQLLLRDTKAGESSRPLNTAALAVLAALPTKPADRNPTDRVLAGRSGRRHELKLAWEEIRRVAELEGVRLHDLRHTVASRSQHSGHSLLVTGALLGHRNLATTKKYAHLIDDPLREAADRVGAEIGALLDGTTTAVTPIRAARA